VNALMLLSMLSSLSALIFAYLCMPSWVIDINGRWSVVVELMR
jgi:hypothetical protein